jgi:hypothetical protein
VSTEEEEITLIVEGDYLSTSELGSWGEEGTEDLTDGLPEKGGEVVQYQFGCRVSIGSWLQIPVGQRTRVRR